MPQISVLTTLYRAAPYVNELYDRTLEVLHDLNLDYEFVFVDDGSPDDAKERVLELIDRDTNVRLIELSRNFGQHKAVMAGLEHVKGDYVFLIDADLEEDPGLLCTFYETITQSPTELDVVYAYMEERRGSLLQRLPGAIFYKLMNLMADIPIPENQLSARLMTRDYVRNLLKYRESHVWLAGIMRLNGYNQKGVPAVKTYKGTSTYSLGIKLTLAADALLSFTNKPLTFVAGLGIAISSVSFLVAILLFWRVLVADAAVDGWMLVLASIWFLGGLTISSVGLVGFYVGRIFLQSKQRPNAVVRKIYN